jgi:hypothetical protein
LTCPWYALTLFFSVLVFTACGSLFTAVLALSLCFWPPPRHPDSTNSFWLPEIRNMGNSESVNKTVLTVMENTKRGREILDDLEEKEIYDMNAYIFIYPWEENMLILLHLKNDIHDLVYIDSNKCVNIVVDGEVLTLNNEGPDPIKKEFSTIIDKFEFYERKRKWRFMWKGKGTVRVLIKAFKEETSRIDRDYNFDWGSYYNTLYEV